jgi:hypothetical protein
MRHQPQPGDVLIAFTNGAYNDGTRAINLRIEDEPTGKTILNVDIDGPTFARLVTCCGIRVDGFNVTLSAYMTGDAGFRLDVRGPAQRLSCPLTGEQLAAILGNAVTRVSGATIRGTA